MATKWDVVWWWCSYEGKWRDAWPSSGTSTGSWLDDAKYRDAESLRGAIMRMGYVAHKGLRSVGPPEGAPSEREVWEVVYGGLPARLRPPCPKVPHYLECDEDGEVRPECEPDYEAEGGA